MMAEKQKCSSDRLMFGAIACLICLLFFSSDGHCYEQKQPNILWITSEDNGIELGCYGDEFATSPNIDSLAAKGIRFNNCWSNAPVCAPARTTIISGMYATSLGASNMRSRAIRPVGTKLLPELLRARGYYCSNNSKEDYNFVETSKPWDESSAKAHWRNRPENAPFFSVFNINASHESQIRKRPHKANHDPKLVPLPPYHPDLPEIRQDWAQYYDKIQEMDAQVGDIVKQLRDDNLLESTIIFYFGDHGSGMPRSKRWLYQSGLNVPMIVSIPDAFDYLRPRGYSPGGLDQRLVSFVDLVPTVLQLVDAPIPEYLQGTPFLGASDSVSNKYLLGFRDRMDERIDMSRAIRTERYLYIRNFMPYRAQGVFLNYMFQTPTTMAWRQAFRNGSLSPHQSQFWQPKPTEELYDLANDTHQIQNIADDPSYSSIKEELRAELKKWMIETKDRGVIPESLVKSNLSSPHWDWKEMIEAAFYDAAEPSNLHATNHENPVVRYWLAQYLRASLTQGEQNHVNHKINLGEMLRRDVEVSVQIVASETIAMIGDERQKADAISQLKSIANLEHSGFLNAVAALNALANLEVEFEGVKNLPAKDSNFEPVYHDYIERLKDYLSHQEH